ARAQGASAIGEIGLDRRLFASPAGDAARQLALLDAQLEIADGLGLPVILHLVRAPGLLLERLEQRGPLRHGGVLHAFAGPAALIPRFARLGLSFSFAGSVARPASRRVREAAQAVPEERLLVETDAPDLSPPGAPIRNEPASLVRVVEALASLRGVPAAALAAGAEANARALFSRRSSA
ncbi:MAG: TatD family hydrolase, partial [Myxococcales bacterium]|nr:TatD family hydrolase [Myxococcales bacterium]